MSYHSLVVLSITLVALSTLVTPAVAGLACSTDADCSSKGKGHCKEQANGQATCVYTSCAAGFWGAGNTYADCFECPAEMTSMAGKAFYNTDCFIPCGESRCYIPEDGYTECGIEASTAKHACFSTCNRDGFVVVNPDRAYASCIPNHQMSGSPGSAGNRTIVNQSYQSREKAILLAVDSEAKAGPAPRSIDAEEPQEQVAQVSGRALTNPKRQLLTRMRRFEKRNVGRRLRKGTDLTAPGHGPAAAMLEHAGEDPLALVSK